MRPRASDEVAVDVSDAPSTSGGDGDLGFWQLLSGREIARPTHPAKGGVRSRVVLLHGWLMSHACWLNTATQLRDRYGHDVLLLDFPGHGRSPLLPEFTDHHPLAFAHRLRAVLRRRVGPGGGWTAPRLRSIRSIQNSGSRRKPRLKILWFCAVCPWAALCPACTRTRIRAKCRASCWSRRPAWTSKWATRRRDLSRPLRVSALHLALAVRARGGRLGRWLVSRGCAPAHAALSHLHLVRDTPTFGVPRDMPARLRRAGVPTALVWGALDQFHTAQIRRWKAGRPHARDARLAREHTEHTEGEVFEPDDERSAATTNASTFRRGKKKDAGVHILVHPYFDHFAACVFLDALRLAERAHFWHDTHDVPPRVNEVFPPVAGARGARGPWRARSCESRKTRARRARTSRESQESSNRRERRVGRRGGRRYHSSYVAYSAKGVVYVVVVYYLSR